MLGSWVSDVIYKRLIVDHNTVTCTKTGCRRESESTLFSPQMCSAGAIRLKGLNPPQMRTYLWSEMISKSNWSVTTYCDWIVDGAAIKLSLGSGLKFDVPSACSCEQGM